MPDKSEPTLMAEMLSDAMYEAYTNIKETWTAPFMMESMTPGDYKRRFQAMTKEQRLQEIDRLGVDEILSRIGRQ